IGSGGFFTVGPAEPFTWGGHYETGTLIWCSRWVTPTAITQCRDALAYPGTRDRAVLLRRVTAVAGDTTIDIRLEPAADYGRSTYGRWSGRHGSRRWVGEDAVIEVHGVDEGRVRNGIYEGQVRLVEGEHRDLTLTITDGAYTDPPADP